jgi:hypothetical protein
MSVAIDDLKLAFRKWVDDGVPATGKHKPDKDEINAALDRLETELSAIGAGILRYETKTLLDADTDEDDGQLAYVWGDSDPYANTVYQSEDGAWSAAAWYFDAVAAVVQPLVDDAEAAATAAAAAAVAFTEFRDNTLSIQREVLIGRAADDFTASNAALAAGTWIFLTPFEHAKVLDELTVTTHAGGGTLTILRFSESGGTYTEEEASAAIALDGSAGLQTFDSDDFGTIAFEEGDLWGFYFSGTVLGRNTVGTDMSDTLAYAGAGHLTSFSAPTEAAGFQKALIGATFSGPEDTVTAERVLLLEQAVGLVGSRDIVLFADSLGTDALGFVDELTALLTDRTVTGQSVGGQESGSVAVRTGAIEADATVSGASIPASGGGVTISAIDPDPFAASIGDPASFIASLHDVPGVLSRSGSTYTFTRSDTGGAIAVTNPVKLRIRSTFASNTTGVGTVLLSTFAERVGVLRNGHNDVFNRVIRDLGSYDRQTVKDYIEAQVEALGGKDRVVVCSITRGYNWLTQTRVNGYLGTFGVDHNVTGWAADDAETIEAVIEAQALNQWMADTFPGFVDLMGAYEDAEPSPGDYLQSVDLGSGHVYDFVNETLLPDGTHGTDGGTAQTLDAEAVADKLDDMGL